MRERARRRPLARTRPAASTRGAARALLRRGSTASTSGSGCSGASRSSPSPSPCSTRWSRARCSASRRIWGNETTIYLSAMAYLIAGGYALLHRRHVRIDVIYEALSPRTPRPASTSSPSSSSSSTADADLGRQHDRLELVPDRRDDGHAVEPADLAGQVRDPARPACCCCCRASPTCCATSAGRPAATSR